MGNFISYYIYSSMSSQDLQNYIQISDNNDTFINVQDVILLINSILS